MCLECHIGQYANKSCFASRAAYQRLFNRAHSTLISRLLIFMYGVTRTPRLIIY